MSVVTALSVRGLMQRGWEVAVVAPRYPANARQIFEPELADAAMTAIRSVPMPGYPEIRLALSTRGQVRRLVESFKPDIVHCATEFMIGRMGLRSAIEAGIPVTTSYHTDFAKYTRSYGWPMLTGPVTRWLARFHRNAERIFTPSASSRDNLTGIGMDDVEIWGRGVDVQLFHPSRRSLALRQKLNLGSAFTFLHVGRLAPEKECELLIDAFALLESDLPPGAVRLVIAGAGPSLQALKARASKGVIFLGNLDRQRELPSLYASADAFVFSSTTETLGLVILESMAAGTPVIAVPAGGVADNLMDEENGLAYSAGDIGGCASAMKRLHSDRALLVRLREGARKTAERRTWEQELDRLDASYREVLTRFSES